LPESERIEGLDVGPGGSSEYRGTALPNEEIVLRVRMSAGQEETVLHEERLTLTPEEERLRTIEIGAP